MTESGVDTSMLSRLRKGTHPITFEALSSLLPVIEKHSSRLEALTLHLAYLADEVVPAYKPDLRIEAINEQGKKQPDLYEQLGIQWIQRARSDPNFYVMWFGLDTYMHHPEREVIIFGDDADSKEKDASEIIERETTIAGKKLKIISPAQYNYPAASNLKVAEPITVSMEEQLAEDLAAQFVAEEDRKNPPATPPPGPHTRV